MRPFVVLKYCSGSVWTRPPAARRTSDARLENASPADAYDVTVSSITVDDGNDYRFVKVPALPREEALPLERCIQPTEPSLTQAISRSVVNRVLAGHHPVMRWPVRISYRDDAGRAYATCCEIRVIRLPLEIGSAVVECEEEAARQDRVQKDPAYY